MSLRTAVHAGLFILASLAGSMGFGCASPCFAQELQWRELDEIAELGESSPRPVLWFRVLGDMKGYM